MQEGLEPKQSEQRIGGRKKVKKQFLVLRNRRNTVLP
jgi:hypothetical protein